MRTLRINRDLSPLLTGATAAVATAGALLALTGSDSALRGPCALLFLLCAPAASIATALRGLDPFARTLCALAGSVVVDMLVAQAMLALHHWSVRGGVVVIAVLSLLLLLLTLLRDRVHRGSPGPDSR
ncbi:hypothetical protein ABT298_24930 [Streptomyces sp. NPDC001034]|uniref:hypothetical protein n=1 Tax=Streptomyces sp. NPDC001034 TaxID=3154375 RepID=UPI0033235521